MGLLSLLLDFFVTLGAPWYLGTFFGVWLFWGAYSIGSLSKTDTLAAIRVQLQRKRPAVIYWDILTKRLAALGRWLTPETVTEHPKPQGWSDRLAWYLTPRAPDAAAAARTGQDPFSWRVLDAALLVAVVYPLLFLLIYWTVTGRDGQIGGAVMLPAEARVWLRYATLCSVSLLLFSRSLEKELASSRIRVFRQFSGWTQLVAGAVAIAVAGAGASASAVAGSSAAAGAGGVAIAVAVAGAAAFAGAFAVAVAVAVAGAGLVAGSVAGAVAGAGAVRRNGRLPGYLCLVAALLAGLLGLVAATDFAGRPEAVRGFFLFIGVLPLLNALFDYVSYGITLTLIRRGLRSGTGLAAVLAFADILAALLLFTGLEAVLIAVIALINHLAGGVAYDLGAVFHDLRDPVARQNYLWLYAMMFSTAVPTLVHAALASLSLQGVCPLRWQLGLLDLQERTGRSLGAEVLYHGGISLMWTLAMMGPVLVVGGIGVMLWQHGGEIGLGYLQVFEWIAGALGQIDRVGPGPLPRGVWT